MDTSPWDSSAADKPVDSDNWANFNKANTDAQAKEAWAEFPEKTGEDNKDNWADFTNFDNIKR